MLEASVVFVSILGGGLLGMLCGVALAMTKMDKNKSGGDETDKCVHEVRIYIDDKPIDVVDGEDVESGNK